MKVKYLFTFFVFSLVYACAYIGNGDPYIGERIDTLRDELKTAKKVQKIRKRTFEEMRDEIEQSKLSYEKNKNQIQSSILSGISPLDKGLTDKWKNAKSQLEKSNDVLFDIKMFIAQLQKDLVILNQINDSVKGMSEMPDIDINEKEELDKILIDSELLKIDIMTLMKQAEIDVNNNTTIILNQKEDLNDLALSIKEGKIIGLNNNIKYDLYNNTASEHNNFLDFNNGKRPLININMSKKADYAEALYHSLSRELERDPTVSFQIVSIASSIDISKRDIKEITEILNKMGVPAVRISVVSHTKIGINSQIYIYAR